MIAREDKWQEQEGEGGAHESQPLQETAPSAAVLQFMIGAVKTRGDAEIAHLPLF
jgi:hypothetical protein